MISTLEHTTALGAFPYSFNEYIGNIDTLLPMAYGSMSTDPLSDLSCRRSGSVIVPVLALTIARKLIGCIVTSVFLRQLRPQSCDN